MAISNGIGSLPQTRELFTAPGSLLGYDPYFQDVQRFQKGGLGTADSGTGVAYSSLQHYNPYADLGPYGASRTAAQRGRSFWGIDPADLAMRGLGQVIGGPASMALGALTGGIGAFKSLSEADKMRTGALPPGTVDPLGFWGALAAIFGNYEDAFTDKDMETISTYGLGSDLGVTTGGYNVADPPGTWPNAPSGGPRFDTPLGRAQYQYAKDELERIQMQGWMSNLADQIAANKEKKFQAQLIDPRRGARIYTMDLPPVEAPRPEVTVEELAPVPTLDELGAWTGGFNWATGDNGDTSDTSGFGVGGSEGLGY